MAPVPEGPHADLPGNNIAYKRPHLLRHAGVLAMEFRRNGCSVEVAEGKLKKLMELANKKRARQTLILGDDEIAQGVYTLKDMATGEQQSVSREALLDKLTCKKP